MYLVFLQNSMEQSVPVRVVRGHISASSYSGKIYTYDGLYKVHLYCNLGNLCLCRSAICFIANPIWLLMSDEGLLLVLSEFIAFSSMLLIFVHPLVSWNQPGVRLDMFAAA